MVTALPQRAVFYRQGMHVRAQWDLYPALVRRSGVPMRAKDGQVPSVLDRMVPDYCKTLAVFLNDHWSRYSCSV